MIVSETMMQYMESSSWIRRMFEEGARLKALYGAENVFDFSLGNPDVPPPETVLETMAGLAKSMSHGYMPNAGYIDVRQTVAAYAGDVYEVDLKAEDIIMTCGAGGGLNVVLKSILNPGAEVIAISPYFVEYGFYAGNHGGTLVNAPCGEDFLPSAATLQKAITPRTKAIIINSPNNPSGRVYPEQTLLMLQDLLKDYPDILVISDEPYRKLVYDAIEVPSVLKFIPNSVVVTSASKELSLAGQRIGYIAVNPAIKDKQDLTGAMILATRILGFVNAPALMQKVLAQCIHDSIDVSIYKRRRDMFTDILDEAGLTYVPPEGTFYLFVKSPLKDDVAFCNALVKENILAVPGKGFGYPGYVRFAYCVDEGSIKGCAPGMLKVMETLGTE
ncbi:MAG TPA: pyridoxal phosphate-dependent aminotransferase [Deltaproteobacteria bacterium]|nr:pyridoxal phosphate-dependent aminotransferase [Deltaproteobacteria bacterium]HPJ94237.1 pyridoxal phosphate-dependent aminotransferase [Deltaproteobacteria bacterium]HPR50926.1 pyridoxal phosphate-dependent aminotransferase [Deltaproteobacteria bacterium]